jgi:2-oxoglutarate ferredoxin oxidoreductase subunit alpha
MAASERSGRPIFLGSYPITPATDILQELVKYKSLGVKVFQAEDEIAGICSAIGASYTGSLALTSTSGPGLSLKSEAIGRSFNRFTHKERTKRSLSGSFWP